MLCGVVPIRTPASGAYDQIDDGVDGFIINFDDSPALAERLKLILTDDRLKNTISQSAILHRKSKIYPRANGNKNRFSYEEVLSL